MPGHQPHTGDRSPCMLTAGQWRAMIALDLRRIPGKFLQILQDGSAGGMR